ncbi:MAG: hypothetical protein UX83_C0011G0001, partial [Candidatus Wolfebacteria bacterium GW2011_GWE2_47_12]
FWDVRNMISSIHNGTKTVKVLSMINRINASPLAEVKSIETGEIFSTDIAHLQMNPLFLKRKYNSLKKYYKKYRPELILKWSSSFIEEYNQYVIIGILPEVNCVLVLNKDGVVDSFGYGHTNLQLQRNISYDQQQEAYMEAYMEEDYYDDQSDYYYDFDEEVI